MPSARPRPASSPTAGGALVELNSETDFVAKSDRFIELADEIVDAADDDQGCRRRGAQGRHDRQRPDRRRGGRRRWPRSSARRSSSVGSRYFDGNVATYMHRRASDLPPAVGVLVEFEGDNDEAARGAAMQIAAMRPQYVTRDEVPADVVAKEREIAEATAREEGKPEQALPKIVEGRLNGFFKDVVLLEQPSVQDSKKTVKARARRGRRHRHPVRPHRDRQS